MSRTARLLELLITLRTRPRFTVQELADDFGVSRRTMLRDLHALSEIGVPLAATPGPGGGYMLIAGRKLLPLSLTVDEAIGIVLSYEAFLQYAESPFAAQSLSAVTKLRNALPAEVVERLDRFRERVTVLEPPRGYEAPHLAGLLDAAMEQRHLRIVYESLSGVTERVIFPYGVFALQGFWYCGCHDYRRDGDVMLRTDRVRSIEVLDDAEPRPDAIPIHQWFERYHTGARMVPLRATVTARGRKHLEVQTLFGTVEPGPGGGGKIDSLVPDTELDFYASRLLTVGTDIRVDEPAALAELIRQKAGAIAALYGDAARTEG